VIATGFQNDGMDNLTTPGQGLFLVLASPLSIEYELICSIAVASQTSTNNWINFCKIVNKPLTNGSQVRGTCAVLSHCLNTQLILISPVPIL
jgi:hypothetical protein